MDNKSIFDLMMNQKYYLGTELKYSTRANVKLKAFEHRQFLDYMDELAISGNDDVKSIDLVSFNSKTIRVSYCVELLSLMSDYLNFIVDDVKNNHSFLSFRNMDSITKSRIFSEIEGSLNIESIPTTRKLLNDLIIENKNPKDNNEQIIVNMSRAIEFVNTCPEFNDKNLHALYSILSFNCLNENQRLPENEMYRNDEVIIDRYTGCPHENIKTCMDSLFKFVNTNLSNSKFDMLLPHIAHYYILYVHPYFDLNGRTARMVSYWINLLLNNEALPPVIADAINQTKSEYYAALRETRDTHNDLTYFLLYIFKISIKYFLVYKNIELIEAKLKNKNIVLSETDKNYFKKIMISLKGTFVYDDFLKCSNADMSKQAAFKILNRFEEFGLLNSSMSTSNKKMFVINHDVVEYELND
ncbi:MAG: Fic family protein [Clostridia bacterium]|nr:Fic family protein [Clostridia bacterium]